MSIGDLVSAIGLSAGIATGALILADIVILVLAAWMGFKVVKYAASWFSDGSNGLNLIGMLIAWRVPGARWAIASLMGTNQAAKSSYSYKRRRKYKKKS